MDRKTINTVRVGLLSIFLGSSINLGAQNLVPNGTFNYSDTCSIHSLSSAQEFDPWFSLFSTPDEYHPCFPEEWSVPDSEGGGVKRIPVKVIWDYMRF